MVRTPSILWHTSRQSIDASALVAAGATLEGDVTIGPGASQGQRGGGMHTLEGGGMHNH